MAEFRREAYEEISISKDKLKQEYADLLNRYMPSFYELTESITSNHLRGLSPYKIESWVELFLKDPMQYLGKQDAKKIEDKLDEAFEELYMTITKKNADTNSALATYAGNIDDIYKRFDMSNLEEIVSDFVRDYVRRIDSHFDAFSGISDRRFQAALDDIRIELKSVLRRKINTFSEEYNQIIKKALLEHYQKVSSLASNGVLSNNEVPADVMEKFKTIMDYSGYDLIEKNGEYYAKNRKNGQIEELIMLSSSQIRLKNSQVVFTYKPNAKGEANQTALNANTNEVLFVSGNQIIACNAKGKSAKTIIKENEGYTFEFNYAKTDDPHVISYIIDFLKEKYPRYYEELMQDEMFTYIVAAIDKFDRENTEISRNSETGKTEINPKKMDIVAKKLRLFGYELLQMNGEYYAKDLMTEDTHKINTEYWGCSLEGIKPTSLNFKMNFNYIFEDKIMTGRNELKKGDIHLYFDNGLTQFSLWKNKTHYMFRLTEQGLNFKKRNADDKEENILEEELLEVLRENMPYLAEFVDEHLKNVRGETTPPPSGLSK